MNDKRYERVTIISMALIILAIGLIAGTFIGVNKYKESCELVGNRTSKWLECQP